MKYPQTIREVEDLVGHPASDILVREREILLIFSNKSHGPTQSPSGDVRWHLPK